MSNLTELLPAGGGGKNVNFVASGTITSGKPVILNSAGTVTEVSGSSVLNGTASNFLSASGAYSAVAYDTTNNQGLVVYRDNNAAIKGRIITVDSSNNITYGTETTIHTASNTSDTTAVYDSTHQRYVVMFRDENTYGQARTLSPSGTGGSAAFTVGNATYFPVSASNNIRATFLDSCFDPDTGQVIVAFADTSNSNHFYMSVGEVRTSPEDIQWGTAVAVDTGGACSSFSVTYDTTANRVLALWELDGTSGKAVVGTVTSGTIGSFGSVVNYTSNPYRPGAAYNVDNNCILVLFRNDAVSNYLFAIGAKVDGSDNSVVFGTAIAVTSGYSEASAQGVTYSTALDKFTAAYYLAAGYQYRNFNVSSAATPVVTLDAAVTFPSPSDGLYANYYDPDEDAVVFTWRGVGGPWVAQAITPGSTNLSATSFIGISDAAISDTASGSVTIKGGISSNVTGLTPNATYYVQDDGSINSPTVYIPYDITSATYADKSFSIAAQETSPRGLAINPAGTKMFVLGTSGDDVNEYALSTAFDVSSASFTQAFSISSQENNPWGIAFNTDGTKMFTTGLTGVGVDEFALSSGFDVSTASFTQFLSTSTQTATPRGIAFNPTGTKMFVVDYSAASVDEYTLSSGFNVSTASYSQTFSVSAQVTEPVGLAFSTDGTEMFVTMINTTYELIRYSLSTAFDISTASYTQRLNVQSATPVDPTEDKPSAIVFNSTGTQFIIIGDTSDTVYQYTASLGSTSTVLAGKALSSTSINLDYTT